MSRNKIGSALTIRPAQRAFLDTVVVSDYVLAFLFE